MTSYLGNFLLWSSLFFAISQFLISRKSNQQNLNFIGVSVIGLLISSTASFFLLMYAYVISDFSLLNVFQNSHTT